MTIVTDSRHQMREVTSDMLVEAFESRSWLTTRLLHIALSGPTQKIAHRAMMFEAMVRHQESQQTAAHWLMDHWQVPVTAHGVEAVPENGPLLILANHAGWGDALALWAKLPRQDIHTVVKANGLLRAMPNLVNHMIVVAKNQEMIALRQIIRCLRDGKTVLLFPRGEIEPDPRLNLSGAIASLQQWTSTVQTITRHVPVVQIVPAAVGGVLSISAQNHPVARLYKNQQTREYVGATLQLMFNLFNDVQIDVYLGHPLSAKDAQIDHIRQVMVGLLSRFAKNTTHT